MDSRQHAATKLPLWRIIVLGLTFERDFRYTCGWVGG